MGSGYLTNESLALFLILSFINNKKDKLSIFIYFFVKINVILLIYEIYN